MTDAADALPQSHLPSYSRIAGHDALVLVPLAAEPAHAVLTFLHGRGEAAADEDGRVLDRAASAERLARHGPPAVVGASGKPRPDDMLARQGRAELSRYLVICPQLPQVRQWREEDADWVTAIEDVVVSENGASGACRHLTGFSWGGAGVTRFASRSDLIGRWSSLWIVDPSPDPSVTPLPPRSLPAMLQFGTYFDHAAMASWRESAGFTGNFEIGGRRAEKDLALGHIETARAAYGDQAAYRWLSFWEKERGRGMA